MKPFEYLEPRTLDEACALLAKHGAEARALAGGTDLMVRMRRGQWLPRYVVNLKRIPGLDYVEYDAEAGLRIGALTRLNDLGRSAAAREHFPAVAETALKIGSVQVRNLATVGGNLCNAAPSADMAPILIGMQATVRLAGPGGERTVALADFFTGPGQTVLTPGEVMVEIRVPVPPPRTGAAYIKHTVRRAMDIAQVGVAAVVTLAGGHETCAEARIVLGAVAPVPMRATGAEAVLRGRPLTDEALAEAGRVAASEARPIDDVRSSAWYRREMVAVDTRRAVRRAAQAAG